MRASVLADWYRNSVHAPRHFARRGPVGHALRREKRSNEETRRAGARGRLSRKRNTAGERNIVRSRWMTLAHARARRGRDLPRWFSAARRAPAENWNTEDGYVLYNHRLRRVRNGQEIQQLYRMNITYLSAGSAVPIEIIRIGTDLSVIKVHSYVWLSRVGRCYAKRSKYTHLLSQKWNTKLNSAGKFWSRETMRKNICGPETTFWRTTIIWYECITFPSAGRAVLIWIIHINVRLSISKVDSYIWLAIISNCYAINMSIFAHRGPRE